MGNPPKENVMKSSATNMIKAVSFIAIGLAIGAAGIYVGDTDDAPGAALLGLLLMIGLVVLGVKAARRKT
jgi:tetrahydromethanopterin S-methyltransferase subunit C